MTPFTPFSLGTPLPHRFRLLHHPQGPLPHHMPSHIHARKRTQSLPLPQRRIHHLPRTPRRIQLFPQITLRTLGFMLKLMQSPHLPQSPRSLASRSRRGLNRGRSQGNACAGIICLLTDGPFPRFPPRSPSFPRQRGRIHSKARFRACGEFPGLSSNEPSISSSAHPAILSTSC